MAGQPTKPGNWGDWAIIETPHGKGIRKSCRTCVHYRNDQSCALHPIVINDVGKNWGSKCGDYQSLSRYTTRPAPQNTVNNDAEFQGSAPTIPCCRSKFGKSGQRICTFTYSPYHMKQCIECADYLASKKTTSTTKGKQASIKSNQPPLIKGTIDTHRYGNEKVRRKHISFPPKKSMLEEFHDVADPKEGCTHLCGVVCELKEEPCGHAGQHCLFYQHIDTK